VQSFSFKFTGLVLDVRVAWGSRRLPPHHSSYIYTHTDTDIHVRTQTHRHIHTERHRVHIHIHIYTQTHRLYIYTHSLTALLIRPLPSHSPHHYGWIAKSHAKNEASMRRYCQTKNSAEESSTAPVLEPRQDSTVRPGGHGGKEERRAGDLIQGRCQVGAQL
jgi:hypothetical protein